MKNLFEKKMWTQNMNGKYFMIQRFLLQQKQVSLNVRILKMRKGLHFSGSRSGSQTQEELKNPHK